MKDRIPLYPGRVKMTPVSGQANIYDMERADQPTQEGTPLNKATLLSDATAAALGLAGDDPTVDEALASISKLFDSDRCVEIITSSTRRCPLQYNPRFMRRWRRRWRNSRKLSLFQQRRRRERSVR